MKAIIYTDPGDDKELTGGVSERLDQATGHKMWGNPCMKSDFMIGIANSEGAENVLPCPQHMADAVWRRRGADWGTK